MTTRERRTLALACVLVAALIAGANATGYVFTAPSGNWNVPGNWDLNNGKVPGAEVDDTAHVGYQNSGCTCTVSEAHSLKDVYPGFYAVGTLDIQATGSLELSGLVNMGWGGKGTILVAGRLVAPTILLGFGDTPEVSRIVQSSGIVTSSVGLYMGYQGDARSSFDQNGGTNYFQIVDIGRNGGTYCVYTITNGSLTTPDLRIGDLGPASTGTLTVAGSANVTVNGNLALGYGTAANQDNVLNMNGGALVASQMLLGFQTASGSHCVTQTAGTVTCTTIYMAYTAGSIPRYVMTGGVLNGGTLYESYYGGAATTASIDLSGGTMTLTNLYMGWGGAGSKCSVNQSGGTNRVITALEIGVNAGSSNAYTVSGGLLNAENIYVGGSYGAATTGTFVHAGGEVCANGLSMNAAGNSTLKLTLPQAGLSPIQVTNNAALAGALTIERATNYFFMPDTVVTVMTYNARSGAFAQTNLLGGLECRVNYDVELIGGRKAITLDQMRPALTRGTIIAVR